MKTRQEEKTAGADPRPQSLVADFSSTKICFIAGTLRQGGAERQLFHILNALRRNGALPRVLCLEQAGFWEDRIRQLGVPVTWIGQSSSRLLRVMKILRELWSERPHFIQSQHFFTNSYAAVSARMLGSGSIGALRSNGAMEAQDCGRLGGWLNLRTPELLAANSSAALRYALERGRLPNRLFLLPSVVDTAQIKPAPGPAPGTLRLLAVGRLVQAKRFDRFLTVLARLRKQFDEDVKGILVGEGPLRPELEAQAAQLGLTPSVMEFRGAAAEIAPFYSQADILVMTSDYEGTPNVLLEGMAAGLPIVSSRVGGVPEVLHSGENGITVASEDLDGLQRALTDLISNPQLRQRLGKNARAYVERHHSLERLPVRLSQLYGLTAPREARVGQYGAPQPPPTPSPAALQPSRQSSLVDP